jgi:hypothetical protein
MSVGLSRKLEPEGVPATHCLSVDKSMGEQRAFSLNHQAKAGSGGAHDPLFRP